MFAMSNTTALLPVGLVCLLVAGCGGSGTKGTPNPDSTSGPTVPPTTQPTGVDTTTSTTGERLIWSDEFDSGTQPSSDWWNLETGYGPNNWGWGNNEWQLYTTSPNNVRVEDGNLVISALCPTTPCGVRDGTITSARITTEGKFSFKYGRVEARIKPPVGRAAWPAFWALGANLDSVGWPKSGEIDFLEVHNYWSNERTAHFSMHWCDESQQTDAACYPEGWVYTTDYVTGPTSLGDDFHIFEAEWDETRMIGKVDGVVHFNQAIDPATMEEFLREHFLIFNVAMGGTLGSNGLPPDGTETFPQTMLVDYVRVYELEPPSEETGDGTVLFDFESGGTYAFSDFEGAVASVVDNPHATGINTSARVGRMMKYAGADYAGSSLWTPVDVDGDTFTMKVWSPRPVDVLFKLESSNAMEVEATHSGGGWEELTFAFPAAVGNYTGITLIFDLGVVGNAGGDPDNWTFYFDDITKL